MALRHVEAARRLAPNDDIVHAFDADASTGPRRWLSLVPVTAAVTVSVGIGTSWPVMLVIVAIGSVLAGLIAATDLVVGLTAAEALLFTTRRVAVRTKVDRLVARVARDDVSRSRKGVFVERWLFGDRPVLISRLQGAELDRWQTANR